MNKYQRAGQRARRQREAHRQRILAAITAILLVVTVFQFGYLCRQVTHPERGLIIRVVDTNGRTLDTSEIRYDVQE
ncbi:MAG: hypothetical protein Q4D42_02945 [Eubacteriales bacterium]|nr:hypothetical protein [Eubacteriales bacterium]